MKEIQNKKRSTNPPRWGETKLKINSGAKIYLGGVILILRVLPKR